MADMPQQSGTCARQHAPVLEGGDGQRASLPASRDAAQREHRGAVDGAQDLRGSGHEATLKAHMADLLEKMIAMEREKERLAQEVVHARGESLAYRQALEREEQKVIDRDKLVEIFQQQVTA